MKKRRQTWMPSCSGCKTFQIIVATSNADARDQLVREGWREVNQKLFCGRCAHAIESVAPVQ